METLHKTLSKPLMIGHSLICYSADVAYICVGKWGVCAFKIYNLNFFISGLIIYIVGILMTMSIGMYFVDISFKLGFAVLFMPVSIALWPFQPTKNKLSENLSIIIRNGMLFALVAIGVCLALSLITNSLFDGKHGMSGEDDFWEAIKNSNTELLTKNFAFDDFHFLIVGFGLIFAFKILASSVNDYLDYFFSDAVFGSDSPMHKMGTQAVGMVSANAVKPAVSFVGDVAKTQTGRAIAGLGGGIAALATKDGRKELAGNIKKGYQTAKRVVTNPRATFNSAMTSVENTTKETAASLVKGVGNTALLFLPWKDSTRKNLEEKFDKWTDENIAQGKLRNLAADTAATGINMFRRATMGKAANLPQNAVTRDDVKGAIKGSLKSVKDDLKTLKDNGIKENAKQGIVKAATLAQNIKAVAMGNSENMMSEEDMREILHDKKENINDKIVKPAANIAKIYAEPITDPLKKGAEKVSQRVQKEVGIFKQDMQDLKEGAIDKAQKFAQTSFAQETVKAWKESDKAPITLQPSAVISAPFRATKGAVKGTYKHLTSMESWVNDIEKLANGWEKFEEERKKGGKVILKKGANIVWRAAVGTTARTLKGTGEETASVLGNALKNFGESLQKNGDKKQKGWTSWQEMHDAEELKKEAIQEDKDYFNSLSDKYDE